MESKEARTRLKSTCCLIIGAGGLIFGIVPSRLLGVRNDGLFGRVGKVLTSEVKVWSARSKASSFNQRKYHLP